MTSTQRIGAGVEDRSKPLASGLPFEVQMPVVL